MKTNEPETFPLSSPSPEQKSRASGRTGLLLSLLCTALGIIAAGIIAFFGPVLPVLAHIHAGWLAAGILLAISLVILDALRLTILAETGTGSLPAGASLRIVLIYALFSAITVTSLGGEASMIVLLKKNGFSLGHAMMVTAVRSSLLPLALLLLVVLGGMAVPHVALPLYLSPLYGPYPIIGLAVAILLCLLLISFMLIRRSQLGRKTGGATTSAAIPRMPRLGTLIPVFLTEMTSAFRDLFHRGARVTGIVIGLSVIMAVVLCTLAPVCVWAFGQDISLVNGIFLGALVSLSMYLSPTPGGSGVAETVFSLLFCTVAGGTVLIAIVILWRFLSSYARVIAGAVCLFYEGKDELVRAIDRVYGRSV